MERKDVDMNRTLFLACVSTLLVHTSSATTVSFDPDDYAAGSAITDASSYMKVDTTGGAVVYAAPMTGTGQALPDGVSDSGPFGKNVFSNAADRNSEWSAWPDMAGANVDTYDPVEWAKDPFALRFSFFQPVEYVSLLGLELFEDAGWGGGDDPLRWWIYDSAGALVHTSYVDSIPGSGSIGTHPELGFDYYFWDFEFAYNGISTVIVGGESEPTTLDRLIFRTSSADVPEPATLGLLLCGLLGTVLVKRRARGKC